MSRTHRRVERIKEKIHIAQVLADYGYRVHLGGSYQEQQFPCDLHGDGQDGKPSARMYPESNSFYCFACDKIRDPIETVRAKEGIGFMEAMAFLEQKYNLPSMPWEDDDDAYHGPDTTTQDEVKARLLPNRTFADDSKQFLASLSSITEDRLMPMDTVLAYWEAYDKLAYHVADSSMPEYVARQSVLKLCDRLMTSLREGFTT